MIDGVFFNDSKHISAQKAAEISGFTRDYVVRLTRAGKLKGRRLARNWFIEEKSLERFLLSQRYSHELRRKKLSEARAKEYKERAHLFLKPILKPKSISPKRVQAHVTTILAKAATAKSGARVIQHAVHMHTPPIHTISPFVDFMHRLSALITALLLTFGTYAMLDENFARFTFNSLRTSRQVVFETTRDLLESPDVHIVIDRALSRIEPVTTDSEPSAGIANSMLASAALSFADEWYDRVSNSTSALIANMFGANDSRADVDVYVVPVAQNRY